MAFMSAKKSEPALHRIAAASRPQKPEVKSVISADMEITGDIRSTGEIELNGKILGDVSCLTLTIGREARVEGKIVAESVQVDGTLDGHIRGETVALAKTAHVTGEILHRSLQIEAGAFIEGKTSRIDGESGKVTPLKLAGPGPGGDSPAPDIKAGDIKAGPEVKAAVSSS